MKLAIVSKTSQLVGGVETYLAELIPALAASGMDLLTYFEAGADGDLKKSGVACATDFDELKRFAPDVAFVHGLDSAELERRILELQPAVYFAHNYDATCISGYKRWSRPAFVPCQKAFGGACLVRYFANGCGGRSPVTMASDYVGHRAHHRNLQRYRAIVTHSEWMQLEYRENTEGKVPIHRIPFLVEPPAAGHGQPPSGVWRVGFLGRLQKVKGGAVLIEAAKRLTSLSRPVEVWFMGEGPEKREWEKLAASASSDRVRFRFWNFSNETQSFLSQIHLLAVPSLWPEPFGRVGVEAAACGVPSVAFAVGGIPEWLTHLVNGVQVGLSSDLAGSFANGIETALEGGSYSLLCEGARKTPSRFSKARHLEALLPHLT